MFVVYVMIHLMCLYYIANVLFDSVTGAEISIMTLLQVYTKISLEICASFIAINIVFSLVHLVLLVRHHTLC